MIFLGADHAGFELKNRIKAFLLRKGFQLQDLSEMFQPGDDYPEISKICSLKVAKSLGNRGILVCGSGVGVCMAANKICGIRAGQAESVEVAKMMREHENANILCLGARILKTPLALRIVDAFLSQRSSRANRHLRRLRQMGSLEQTPQ